MTQAHPRRARAPTKPRTLKQGLQALPVWGLLDRLHNPHLTEQEHEVHLLFLELGNDKQVAVLLHITAHTVRNHLEMIEQKMGLRGRCALLLHSWKRRSKPCRVPPVSFEGVARRRNPA